MLTWANYHPEVVEAFQDIVPWPCEKISTGLGPCSQPCVVMGADEELLVEGLRACQVEDPYNCEDATGFIYHSTDGGVTWAKLCEVPLDCEIPAGYETRPKPGVAGVGYLEDGTLLAHLRIYYRNGPGGVHDQTVHSRVMVTRSGDRGKTWEPPVELDPSPFEAMGGNKARFHQRPDGTVLLPMNCTRYARPGKPLAPSDIYECAQVYASTDSGRSWHKQGDVNRHSDETDFLQLAGGRMLATTRYQRTKVPDDPSELATPYVLDPEHRKTRPDCPDCKNPTLPGGHSIYKQTAICYSDDGGKNFSEHRLLTAWVQQTACLARISDGTVIMPFGHKENVGGQRFMVSYDDGQSWAKTVFELNRSGWYASSVVLSDDTIVTVYVVEQHSGGKNELDVLRWKIPPRDIVGKKGFFKPRSARICS